MPQNNIYRESSRTLTTQVTSMLTTLSTRSALYRQSESVIIPPTQPLTNIDRVGITKDEPFIVDTAIKYTLQLKANTNFRVVLVKDGNEFPIEVKGLYIVHGSFVGSLRVETDSEEPVMISLIYA